MLNEDEEVIIDEADQPQTANDHAADEAIRLVRASIDFGELPQFAAGGDDDDDNDDDLEMQLMGMVGPTQSPPEPVVEQQSVDAQQQGSASVEKPPSEDANVLNGVRKDTIEIINENSLPTPNLSLVEQVFVQSQIPAHEHVQVDQGGFVPPRKSQLKAAQEPIETVHDEPSAYPARQSVNTINNIQFVSGQAAEAIAHALDAAEPDLQMSDTVTQARPITPERDVSQAIIRSSLSRLSHSEIFEMTGQVPTQEQVDSILDAMPNEQTRLDLETEVFAREVQELIQQQEVIASQEVSEEVLMQKELEGQMNRAKLKIQKELLIQQEELERAEADAELARTLSMEHEKRYSYKAAAEAEEDDEQNFVLSAQERMIAIEKEKEALEAQYAKDKHLVDRKNYVEQQMVDAGFPPEQCIYEPDDVSLSFEEIARRALGEIALMRAQCQTYEDQRDKVVTELEKVTAELDIQHDKWENRIHDLESEFEQRATRLERSLTNGLPQNSHWAIERIRLLTVERDRWRFNAERLQEQLQARAKMVRWEYSVSGEAWHSLVLSLQEEVTTLKEQIESQKDGLTLTSTQVDLDLIKLKKQMRDKIEDVNELRLEIVKMNGHMLKSSQLSEQTESSIINVNTAVRATLEAEFVDGLHQHDHKIAVLQNQLNKALESGGKGRGKGKGNRGRPQSAPAHKQANNVLRQMKDDLHSGRLAPHAVTQHAKKTGRDKYEQAAKRRSRTPSRSP